MFYKGEESHVYVIIDPLFEISDEIGESKSDSKSL